MPTVYRLLDPRRTFLSSSGAPLSGGKLWFYEAGTTAPKDTYADDTTANANPVVLNSRGEPDTPILGTTGAYKVVLTDAANVTIWTEDDVSPVNDVGSVGGSLLTEWIPSGRPAIYQSSNQFAMSTDVRTTFHVGRRVRYVVSGNRTGYGYVSAVSYSAPTTTVTIVVIDESLDSGLSSMDYAALSASEPSYPANLFINSCAADTLSAQTRVSTQEISGTAISLVDSGGTRWQKDSSGRWLNVGNTQPSFKAQRATSDQTTGSVAIFNDASANGGFNYGSHYSTSTGLFTAPVAGIYEFSTSLLLGNSSGSAVQLTASFVVAGSFSANIGAFGGYDATSGSADFAASGSIIVKLAANDTVGVSLSPSANVPLRASAQTCFSGRLLG